ncbi:MAG: N-acetylmuramoyl-L-alanine amidase family protein [Acidimicrobiales bacterium]
MHVDGTRRERQARRRERRRRRRRRAVRVAGAAALLCAGAVLATVHLTGGSGGESRTHAGSDPVQPRTAAQPDNLDASPDGTALDPALFTDGSCVAFSPTAGDRHETVFLDAGHGGRDPGAVGTTTSGRTIHEASETLPVELDAMALLRTEGYRVVVSRTRQTAVTRPLAGDVSGGVFTVAGELREIESRDYCANIAHADALVGIYFDAGGSPQDAGSVTAYDRARPFWRRSLALATLVQRDVLAEMNAHGWQIPDDGVESDVSLGGPPLSRQGGIYGHLLLLGPAMRGYFSTPSTMPGALIEPLFITDPFEGSIAASSVGQHAIASGIADAVRQFLAG